MLLPDCIQQNLYRYMLERHYGLCVKAMNLVVLCPDYPTYYVAQVPKMDQLIQQIVTICQQQDLGHRLLIRRNSIYTVRYCSGMSIMGSKK